MQAHANKLATDSEAPDNRFKGFDEFMASAKASAATKVEPAADTAEVTKEEEEGEQYSPSKGVMTDDDPDVPDLVSLIASSETLGRKEVCEDHHSQELFLLSKTTVTHAYTTCSHVSQVSCCSRFKTQIIVCFIAMATHHLWHGATHLACMYQRNKRKYMQQHRKWHTRSNTKLGKQYCEAIAQSEH